MTKITLHRASTDNAGNFLDAGTEVAVGPADNHIHADRAQELLDSHGAIEHPATASNAPAKAPPKKSASKPKRAAKTAAAPSPASAPAPAPPPTPEAPAAADATADHASA